MVDNSSRGFMLTGSQNDKWQVIPSCCGSRWDMEGFFVVVVVFLALLPSG